MGDRLKGKVAIVTGGGRGIGREYALALAGEGAKVCIAELNADNGEKVAAQLRGAGVEAMATATDVGDEKSCLDMADKVASRFGGVDILVNNAAVFADEGGFNPLVWDFLSSPMEQWRALMRVNVEGIILTTRAVVPSMRARGGGKIINQSSVGAWSGFGPYNVSKNSVVELTKWFASALGKDRINVNAIAPGIITTEAVLTRAKRTPEQLKAYLDAMQAMIPWGRVGEPHDLLGALVFLASAESDYISGQTISVDGGCVRRP
ncbi:MAG TPA: glucose 1-dehydrogenase [Burkholderiales bacterium]|nr:glucose 1-dehydrogenase [Burkholderiales bacterium]